VATSDLAGKEIAMLGSRVARTLSWLVLSFFVLLLPLACKAHSTPAADSSSASNPSSDEAERTRKMEEKAADIKSKEEEIRNMQGTDEEKADAVKKLDAERQELIEMQDKGK
jgi:hypothetical protein